MDFEFLVELPSVSHRWFRFPRMFHQAVAETQTPSLLLQVDGCPQGPFRTSTRFLSNGGLHLTQGWKTFTRGCKLCRGDFLLFKYNVTDSLSVKFFSAIGDRVECRFKSSSSGGIDSPDEEDNTTF